MIIPNDNGEPVRICERCAAEIDVGSTITLEHDEFAKSFNPILAAVIPRDLCGDCAVGFLDWMAGPLDEDKPPKAAHFSDN